MKSTARYDKQQRAAQEDTPPIEETSTLSEYDSPIEIAITQGSDGPTETLALDTPAEPLVLQENDAPVAILSQQERIRARIRKTLEFILEKNAQFDPKTSMPRIVKAVRYGMLIIVLSLVFVGCS